MNIVLALKHCFKFLVKLFIGKNSTQAYPKLNTRTKNVSEKQLQHLSTFHRCMLYIINFRSFNIDPSVVAQPVILLKYFSFLKTDDIFPVELCNKSEEKLLNEHLDYYNDMLIESRYVNSKEKSRMRGYYIPASAKRRKSQSVIYPVLFCKEPCPQKSIFCCRCIETSGNGI